MLAIVIMLVLLLLEGFFSGSEIALVNADKLRLRARAGKGERGAQFALRLFERPEVLLTTTLVGTNIAVVTLTTLGTLLMMRAFGDLGELTPFCCSRRCCWCSARSCRRASISSRPIF